MHLFQWQCCMHKLYDGINPEYEVTRNIFFFQNDPDIWRKPVKHVHIAVRLTRLVRCKSVKHAYYIKIMSKSAFAKIVCAICLSTLNTCANKCQQAALTSIYSTYPCVNTKCRRPYIFLNVCNCISREEMWSFYQTDCVNMVTAMESLLLTWTNLNHNMDKFFFITKYRLNWLIHVLTWRKGVPGHIAID